MNHRERFAGRRWMVGLAAWSAAALLAGCASAVAGSAQAVPGAPTITESGPTDSSGGPETGEQSTQTETSATETSATETSAAETSATETSATETSATSETSDTSGTDTPTDTTSTESSSTPEESGSGTSAAPEFDLYPTAARPLAEHPAGPESAAILEGHRLAQYVVAAPSIVPLYSHSASLSTLPMKGPSAISLVLPDPTPKVAERGGMYAGFSAARSQPDGEGALLIAAFVYPDAAAAAKAAGDLSASTKGDKDVALMVPGQPKAVGWTGPATKTQFAHAFVAVGPVVAYAWTEDVPAKKAGLPTVIGKALTAEVAALKGYQPTPKAKLQDLRTDVDGLYARTLPQKPDNRSVVDGVWAAKGALHYQTSYTDSAKLFAETGVDVVSMGRDTLYRAKDAAGADKIRDAFIAETGKSYSKMTPYDPGTTAGAAKCLQDSLSATYYCMATIDRVAMEYSSDSPEDMKKSLDAQVALLTG
jgi:hypothetical protein